MAVLLLLHSLTLACPIADGTAFGEPYTVAAEPAPFIEKGHLVFQATYEAHCGGAPFDVSRFEEQQEGAPAILASSIMLVASRSPPTCSSPSLVEDQITEEIRAPLPAVALTPRTSNSDAIFFACPPGSLYEMVRVDERAARSTPFIDAERSPIAATLAVGLAQPPEGWDEEEDGLWEAPTRQPSDGAGFGAAETAHDESSAYADPAQEAQRVAAELATQEADDSIAHLAHCEKQQLAGTPSKCCSEQMMEGLRTKVAADAAAADLQVPVADSELNASEASDADAALLAPGLQAAAVKASGGAFALSD